MLCSILKMFITVGFKTKDSALFSRIVSMTRGCWASNSESETINIHYGGLTVWARATIMSLFFLDFSFENY